MKPGNENKLFFLNNRWSSSHRIIATAKVNKKCKPHLYFLHHVSSDSPAENISLIVRLPVFPLPKPYYFFIILNIHHTACPFHPPLVWSQLPHVPYHTHWPVDTYLVVEKQGGLRLSSPFSSVGIVRRQLSSAYLCILIPYNYLLRSLYFW